MKKGTPRGCRLVLPGEQERAAVCRGRSRRLRSTALLRFAAQRPQRMFQHRPLQRPAHVRGRMREERVVEVHIDECGGDGGDGFIFVTKQIIGDLVGVRFPLTKRLPFLGRMHGRLTSLAVAGLPLTREFPDRKFAVFPSGVLLLPRFLPLSRRRDTAVSHRGLPI